MPEHDIVDIRWFLAVARRWLWLVVGCLLVGVAGALIITSRTTPVYRASVSLLVQPPSVSGANDYQALATSERLTFTYSQMLLQSPVLESVIEQLDLPEAPDTLRGMIEVEPIANTQLIRLRVEHNNPALAADIANTLASSFIAQVQSLHMNRYAESLTSLESQIDELAARLQEIQSEMAALDTAETPEAEAKLAHLQNISAGYRNTHALLIQNYEQMRLSAMQSAQSVIVTESARTPEQPIQRRRLYLTMGGIVGLLAGLGAAFLLESLDDTIKSPEDVRRAADLATLGTITRLPKGDRQSAVTTRLHAPHAEAFRVLCTNICFGQSDRSIRSLLVTSPDTGEGKSLIAANLAVAMAQVGFRVIAVDADTRRSRLGGFFGLHPRSDGLVRALSRGSVDGLLRSTHVAALSVLTSGELPTNPGQLLGSQRLQRLIEELGQQCDIVVIDSPPVLPVADTMLMAGQVDGILLVLHAGHTQRQAARQAAQSLRQMGANLVGAVLNDIPSSGRHYYRSSVRHSVGQGVEAQGNEA